MKLFPNQSVKNPIFLVVLFAILVVIPYTVQSFNFQQNKNSTPFQYTDFKGEVVDAKSGDAISSAQLTVEGSNISTVTNSEGEFSLKIPSDLINSTVTVSYLGYKSKSIALNSFNKEFTTIALEESIEVLSEVSIFTAKDAQALVSSMLEKRGINYFGDPTKMTAFYREIIKKRRTNVSLSEAVVYIYKQPNNNKKKDLVSIYKARKSTNYDKLDTLALKLRGGPFNILYIDLMKYSEFIFNPDNISEYKFNFSQPTKINDRYAYVVDFEEKDKLLPWYYGKLFIDVQTHSLMKASFKLNVDDKESAAKMFVKRKPSNATVYPIDVNYQIDYLQSNGRWYYGYGNALLEFKVDWDKRLFNSRYTLNSEMVVTNWEVYGNEEPKMNNDFIRPSVIMVDDISGFADDNFWGNNNIIEPEKSIQNAIEKIQRQLKKE
tara:strand:+ start:72 stop:1373 length:1302 start_codon:yes stop_codon:yes gene_type:complete